MIVLLAAVHAGATLAMAGLIWFVQVVHYPLFAALAEESSVAYAEQHAQRTTWVVAPLMAVEVLSAGALLWLAPDDVIRWVGAALLGVVWGSTFFVQVPCHTRLAKGYCAATIRRLVWTNWIRTVAWSVRGVLALWIMAAVAAE